MRTIPFGKPIIGDEERKAVMDVLCGSQFVHGPKSKAFEADFAAWTGAPRAVSVASCTAGLHLLGFDLGLQPGDEVIVPAQTHVATAHAVEYTGARPVFVDAEPVTGNMDCDALEAAVTPRTRAISVVHFLGVPADMERINAVARKHELFVIEDCALAVGTRLHGVHAGLLGDAGAFSFYPVKHMTTAEGGMVISRHEDLLARLDKKRAFGVDRVVGERSVPGVYDVTMLGYNYRMNELEAALGVEQVKRLDGFLAAREENFTRLAAALAEVEELRVLGAVLPEGAQSSRYCLSVVLREDMRAKRLGIVNFLKAQGVGTSVYYPQPVPEMTYYREKYGATSGAFPHAAAISQGVALPVGPHLDAEDMDYIATAVTNAIQEVRK
ncbi:MAG: DegT/DnrJ/EryC1/StrS aminotransferase family protein [Desulfovibrionaceae bacterium]